MSTSSSKPLGIETLEAEWYFESAGLKVTANEVRNLIGSCKRSLKLVDFQKGLPKVMNVFEKEYCKDTEAPARFRQEKNLIENARESVPADLERAWNDVNLSEDYSGPSTHYVDSLLNVYSNSIEDFYTTELSKRNPMGTSIPVRIDEIRYLRLCLTYVFFCESLFDEMTLFHYKLLVALKLITIPAGQTPPTSTKGYASKMRAAGFDRLVSGYDSVVRNGIAHRHIKTEADRSWTFSDPLDKGSKPVNCSYGRFKSDFYEAMKYVIGLWELFTVLNTLERSAAEDLH